MPKRDILVGSALLLLVLAAGVLQVHGLFDGFDLALTGHIAGWREGGGAGLTPFLLMLSKLTDSVGRLIMLALLAIPFFWRAAFRRWLWLASVSVVAMLLNSALKRLFQAERPDVMTHLDHILSYSFPSGHACGNMVFFGALAMVMSRSRIGWVAALPVILLIGVSRVWLGVHWPSDVICGWIEGAAILLIARQWLPPVRRQ